jgi:hypothetical protein
MQYIEGRNRATHETSDDLAQTSCCSTTIRNTCQVPYQEPLELVYGKSAEDMALEHHDVLTELYIRMAKMSAKQGILGWVNRGPLGGMICLLGSAALVLLLCSSLV